MKIAAVDLLCVKWLFVIGSYQVWAKDDILKYDHKHRTHKAVEKANGLWCHRCYTMDINKEFCMNVTRNDTSLHHKCEGDMRMCMVKRVSYSTTSSNGSIAHNMWSLERNCTQKCEPGCIIIGEQVAILLEDALCCYVAVVGAFIGERIKLYQCVSCCEGRNFCNGGNEGSAISERTKIRVCSTCCETAFCNFGTGASARPNYSKILLLVFFCFLKLHQQLQDLKS